LEDGLLPGALLSEDAPVLAQMPMATAAAPKINTRTLLDFTDRLPSEPRHALSIWTPPAKAQCPAVDLMPPRQVSFQFAVEKFI
jgi:hypothetical protein